MYNYFISYIGVDEFGNPNIGSCVNVAETKIKDIEYIRAIEKNLCEENKLIKVTINNFILLK